MLQYTLARDSFMVGYGAARASDASPVEPLPQSKAGARPALFFAPTRDANGLLTRKVFTHILLVRKTPADGSSRAVLLPFPTSEWVADAQLEQLLPSDQPVSVATCVVKESSLHPQADLAQSLFSFEHPEFKEPVTVRIEGCVFENSLREQFVIEKVSHEFACFVLHWHQPEIGGASLLQTTYAHLASGALVSYRNGNYFSAKLLQAGSFVAPAYASCAQMQSGGCAIRDFSVALSRTLTTLKQMGSGAPRAVRLQVLSRWQQLQSEPIATGTSQGLMVWPVEPDRPVELSIGWHSTLESAVARHPSPFASARASVLASDEAWLMKMNERKPVDLPDMVDALYQRSLLTLKQMQDPGGGIIAAPEFQFEFTACGGYGYCWGRDAGFISLAMDTAGLHEESAHFYQYMAKCQSEDGSFLHRHDMDGHLGPSWGLLQPDETGSVLFGLWKHVQLSGRKETAAPLRGMVERAAQWLNTCRFDGSSWPAEGFDLWEEREGVHLYSVAAVIAGLSAAAQLAEHMGWTSPVGVWRERATQLSQLLEEHLVSDQVAGETSFARTLFLKNATRQPSLQNVGTNADGNNSLLQPQRWMSDFVVDISLLGVVEPFNALPQNVAAKMLPALCKSMRRHLWRSGVGGIGRYEGDHYRDGQPWILTTLWLALAAARCGDKALTTECLAWVLAHTPREGQLPEQIDPHTGEPSWVMPLTWSHAMFVLACAEISKDIWSGAVQASSAISKNKNTSTRGL